MNFKSYLEEGRDAPLYHSTTFRLAKDILLHDTLYGKTWHHKEKVLLNTKSKARRKYDDPTEPLMSNGVSLTRSLQFAKHWRANEIIFQLDQRLLTQRYKILPANYFVSEFTVKNARRDERTGVEPYNKKPTNEYEEFLIGDIKNISKYIDKIYVKKNRKEDVDKDPFLSTYDIEYY